MLIINLVAPFLDNHLAINGVIKSEAYQVAPLSNVSFKELATNENWLANSLSDINFSLVYAIAQLQPVDFLFEPFIQDLPGNDQLVNFGSLPADRLYLMSALPVNIYTDCLRIVSATETIKNVDTNRIISRRESILVDALRKISVEKLGRNEAYLNLVTSEHRNRFRFISLLSLILSNIDNITILFEIFDTYFDLDIAAGAVQDIIGDIVGVKRTVNFQPSDGSSPILDDNTFRLIIKAKIARNQWDGTMQQIPILWSNLFPQNDLIVIDNQDMSLSALVYGFSVGIQQDLVKGGYIIPKPQGVKINYAFPRNSVFSYGFNNELFKGYGEGYWVEYDS